MFDIVVTSVIMSFLTPQEGIIASEISKAFNKSFNDELYWKNKIRKIPKDSKFCYFVFRKEQQSTQIEKVLLQYHFKNEDFRNWKEITKEERIEIFKSFCGIHSLDFKEFQISHDLFDFGTKFSKIWLEEESPTSDAPGNRNRSKFILEYRVDKWKVKKTKDICDRRGSFVDIMSDGLKFIGNLAHDINDLYKGF